MRLAVTYENENVGQHFGRTEQFKVYDIKNGEIKSSKVMILMEQDMVRVTAATNFADF